jgi:hypothetical protein
MFDRLQPDCIQAFSESTGAQCQLTGTSIRLLNNADLEPLTQ